MEGGKGKRRRRFMEKGGLGNMIKKLTLRGVLALGGHLLGVPGLGCILGLHHLRGACAKSVKRQLSVREKERKMRQKMPAKKPRQGM